MEKEKIISILDELPVSILVLNDAEEFLYINKNLLKLLNKREPEIFANPFYDLLYFDSALDKESLQENIKKIKSGDEYETTVQFMGKSGKMMTGTLSMRKIVLEKTIYYLGRIEDITTRLTYEKILTDGIERIQKQSIETEEALAIIKKQNKELSRYKRMLLEELRIATVVQKTIMPHVFPKIPGGDFFGKTKQVRDLGGDLYDYLKFDEERYGFFIADASGHGVSAALITAMLKVHMDHLIKEDIKSDYILTELNTLFSGILGGTGLFVTAVFVIIDFKTGQVSYTSAGHHSILFYQGGKWVPLSEKQIDPVLGIDGDSKYHVYNTVLEHGENLLLFTDGIIEARNRSGRFWGQPNLIETLIEAGKASAEKTVKFCFKVIEDFCGGNDRNDDRTIFFIKKTSE